MIQILLFLPILCSSFPKFYLVETDTGDPLPAFELTTTTTPPTTTTTSTTTSKSGNRKYYLVETKDTETSYGGPASVFVSNTAASSSRSSNESKTKYMNWLPYLSNEGSKESPEFKQCGEEQKCPTENDYMSEGINEKVCFCTK